MKSVIQKDNPSFKDYHALWPLIDMTKWLLYAARKTRKKARKAARRERQACNSDTIKIAPKTANLRGKSDVSRLRELIRRNSEIRRFLKVCWAIMNSGGSSIEDGGI